MSKFKFQVTIGDYPPMNFSEVTGLKKAAVSKRPKGKKIPLDKGMVSYSNITLRKGVYSDEKLMSYFTKLRNNEALRDMVTIELFDESQNPVSSWELKNAFPVLFMGEDLKEDGNEVAIESLVLAHEGMTQSK